jgi:hypothetical protein
MLEGTGSGGGRSPLERQPEAGCTVSGSENPFSPGPPGTRRLSAAWRCPSPLRLGMVLGLIPSGLGDLRRALHPEAVPLHPRACPGPHPGRDLARRPLATREKPRAGERTSLNPCPSLVRIPLDRKTAPLPDRHRSQRLPWLARTPPCEREHLIRIPFNRRVPIWT